MLFAISRKFNDEVSDELFDTIVRPSVEERGEYVICTNSPNDERSIENWIPRMNLMLDVSDIHVILDYSYSSNTAYEFEASNLSCLFGFRPCLYWYFGLLHPISVSPVRVVISSKRDCLRRLSATYSNTRPRSSLFGRFSGHTIEVIADVDELRDQRTIKIIGRSIQSAATFVGKRNAFLNRQYRKKARWYNVASIEWELYDSYLPVVPTNRVFQICRYIFSALKTETPITELQSVMMSHDKADFGTQDVLASHIEDHRENIIAYNVIIGEFAERLKRAMSQADPSSQKRVMENDWKKILQKIEYGGVTNFHPADLEYKQFWEHILEE